MRFKTGRHPSSFAGSPIPPIRRTIAPATGMWRLDSNDKKLHRIILKHACQHHAVQLVNMIADADTAVLHLFLRYPADHPKSVQQPEHRRKMCRISHFTIRYNGRLESNTPTRVLSAVPFFDPVRSFTKIIPVLPPFHLSQGLRNLFRKHLLCFPNAVFQTILVGALRIDTCHLMPCCCMLIPPVNPLRQIVYVARFE